MTQRTATCDLQIYVMGNETSMECSVTYEYEPAERGAREYGTGLQMEPDYPASVSLCSVEVERNGKPEDVLWLICDKARGCIEADLLQEEQQAEEYARQEAAWWRMEERREWA